MDIEIITIGDEVLSGHTVNTNAAFLSLVLEEEGYPVRRHTTVPDVAEAIKGAIEEAFLRKSFVITTGGLGPTFDDRTKDALLSFFAASRPNRYFQNDLGTARGLFLSSTSGSCILLPGVPEEMKRMFLSYAFPFLKEKFPSESKIFLSSVNLCILKEIDVLPFLEDMQEENIKIGIYPAYATLKIDIRGDKEKVLRVKKEIEDKFSDYVFQTQFGKIEEAVRSLFLERNETIIFGESCTGGALASKITALTDASFYFLGSVVSYSNEMKRRVLGVSEKTLKYKGAVSEETVQEMIDGLFKISKADYAVAISGIAGPQGGTIQKPVGTVYIGIGKRNEISDIGKVQAPSEREAVIEYSCNFALSLLWRRLKHGITYFKK